jgi:single-stranded-DNA-specific exonuclease
MRMLARRGIHDVAAADAYLHPDLQPSTRYPGLEPAVARLQGAVANHEPICVWGDFDADGQTATAVLVSALRALGAPVTYYVPVRAREGHGVHVDGLRAVLDEGAKLVLTCDTGIAAHEAVAYAKTRGVDVLITDHHDLGDSVPAAFSVMNPKLLPPGHPLAQLSGVGVAYKLAEALLETCGRESGVGLDLVGIGLIADLATLTGETRALAQEGIRALHTTSSVGLQMVAELAAVNLGAATEDTIAYALAPRLNAVGRLGDANEAVELLLTEDRIRARVIAAQVEGLNTQRRLLSAQVFEAAEERLKANPSWAGKPVIVLDHATWPAGVLGIVAARLCERYRKPAILLSGPADGTLQGSARSIEGLHITRAIAAQKRYLSAFGGHPMAAGLSLRADLLPTFRKGIETTIQEMLQNLELAEECLQIEDWMPLNGISQEMANQLERLAPYGSGNPLPVFAARALSVQSSRPIGAEHLHHKLTVTDRDGVAQELIWWNSRLEELPGGRFDLAFTVRARSFQGVPGVAVELRDVRPTEDREIRVDVPQIEVVDLRKAGPSLALPEGCLVWAEGADSSRGLDRYHLQPANDFAIWTAPAAPGDLREALAMVRPRRVYLLARESGGVSSAETFLKRLAGLAKFALAHRGGETSIAQLAAACAQRELTIRLGLEWLVAGGHVQLESSGDDVQLSPSGAKTDATLRRDLQNSLRSLIEEAAAYRSHFRKAPAKTLF